MMMLIYDVLLLLILIYLTNFGLLVGARGAGSWLRAACAVFECNGATQLR